MLAVQSCAQQKSGRRNEGIGWFVFTTHLFQCIPLIILVKVSFASQRDPRP